MRADDRRGAPTVLALVGPTGAGKSTVARPVAERLGAEIVAVDAFTLYRGMDVGTAKPTPEDRRRVRHHLIDVLDPGEERSVQWFQQAARQAIDGVIARGRTPLLVGGSGLYYRAAVDPLVFPPSDPAVRAAVAQRFGEDAHAAHAALARVDPAAAARMDPANLRRAVRALEVIELTGRPFSAWRQAWDDYRPRYPGLAVVGLAVGREALVAAIDRRVDAMLAEGLVEECRRLARRPLSSAARQAIGYAEILEHLESRLSLAEAMRRTKARTRRYAARQARWFHADPRVQWVTADDAAKVLRARCDS